MPNIKIYNVPDEIFKTISDKRIAHMRKCKTCKYGLGAATIAFIRELMKEIKELKNGR